MANWLYQGKEYSKIEEFPCNAVGFVYKVTNTTNDKFYVGKKILRNVLTKKLTKKEIDVWVKPGRIPKKRKETKESNWTDYYGSSKLVIEDIKLLGKDTFKREILRICTTKKQMSYWETYYQMVLKVLEVDSYNENVLGKFYRRDVSPAAPDSQDEEE